MSEIRDKVKGELDIALENYFVFVDGIHKQFEKGTITWEEEGLKLKELKEEIIAEQILSIPELAIVDREAKLPEKEFVSSNENCRYKEAQRDMLKAGWVKEVK